MFLRRGANAKQSEQTYRTSRPRQHRIAVRERPAPAPGNYWMLYSAAFTIRFNPHWRPTAWSPPAPLASSAIGPKNSTPSSFA